MAKIKHIAITCEDPDAVAKFYKEGFELFEVARNARQVQLSDGDINLTILKWKTDEDADVGPNGENYSGIHHIGFQVDNLEDTGARLRDIDGNEIVRREVGGGRRTASASGRGEVVGSQRAGPGHIGAGLAPQIAHGLATQSFTNHPVEPGEAVFGSRRHQPEGGHVMEATCVTHIGICVRDMNRSLAFYRDILGMTVLGDRMTDPTERRTPAQLSAPAPGPTLGQPCLRRRGNAHADPHQPSGR